MPKRIWWMLVSGIILVLILSIILEELQWGPLVGLLVGIAISEYYREREGTDDVEVDERVQTNIGKFMIFTFSLSNLLLLIYLFVSEFVLKQEILPSIYLILYLLITFFIAFFVGPYFLKRK
ncbi:hypothetical protein EU245_12110 [Lentibacillus lipolyticus]|nr:hypothetical protein EU245_12110 [Lentibacillus lipolyticus]